MVKQRRSEEELRRMMLAAARKYEDCSELEDIFIFGPTPRPDANWGFGTAGKDNKVSVACYTRLNQIASNLQAEYELHPIKAAQRTKHKEDEVRSRMLIDELNHRVKNTLSTVQSIVWRLPGMRVSQSKRVRLRPDWLSLLQIITSAAAPYR